MRIAFCLPACLSIASTNSSPFITLTRIYVYRIFVLDPSFRCDRFAVDGRHAEGRGEPEVRRHYGYVVYLRNFADTSSVIGHVYLILILCHPAPYTNSHINQSH